MASSGPSPVPMIDPRGHRFGAALSVGILAVAFIANAPILVLAVTLMLGASAAFGTLQAVRPALVRAVGVRPDRRQASAVVRRDVQVMQLT